MILHQADNSLANYHYNICTYTDRVWDDHFHRNLEVIYVLHGAVLCTVNKTTYRLETNDFGLCLPYDTHSYKPEPDTRYWVLVFSADYVRLFTKQISGKSANGFRFQCSAAVTRYIHEQLITAPSPTLFTLKSCLYAICEAYLDTVLLSEKDRGHEDLRVRIFDYILENHTRQFSLTDIARQLGYDYHYMSRYFRKIFNMPFRDFVNIYRLETAIRLLEDTDNTITEITYESGFQSVRSFNYFFKNQLGISPTQYRKNVRK